MNQKIVELQQQIKEAQKEIEEIRIACPHTEVYEGIWEWAAGHQFPAKICSNCGSMVKALIPATGNTLISTTNP